MPIPSYSGVMFWLEITQGAVGRSPTASPGALPWRPSWHSANSPWCTGRDAQIATNRATMNRFCIMLLKDTAWRNRSSPTTQSRTRLSLHGVQILDGTSVYSDAAHDRSLLYEVHVPDR